MKKGLLTLMLGSALALGACGGNGETTTEPAPAPEEGGGSGTSAVDAEQVVQQNCISCHGENLEGQGNFPALNNVGSRLTKEEIRAVIDNGQGAMPADIIQGEEADAVAEWLANKK
ncbi:cytochrome c [Planococcus sp. N028]|uniref:Cytochrome c n=1 Tax=Planococcus shixiaomingii TaxID=3058393 RepID=A0ABT8N0T6_9BACL|nr:MULTISPECIES: cytochrome c [unclassified Planococcus (in: firmicutes)]MDN7241512.1 cytochrome c [Planococcus sp. N028]WKA53764.1 cytochrome c [Planococcus sp. N022]